jgi:predicted metal-dependent peptidase
MATKTASKTTSKTTKTKNADKMAKLIGPYDRAADNMARDRLVTSRVALLMWHSFFGNLATRLKLVNADEWLATAATDGRNFYYNSRFINMLQTREVEFLFGHEVLHLVYDHLDRRDDRNPEIWNVACDYAVNADLRNHKVGQFITTVPCLYESKYEKKSANEIYDDLMQNVQKISMDDLIDQLLDDHMDGDDGDDGDGDKEGNGKRPGKMSAEEREQLRQEIKENVIAAAKAAKGAGHGTPEAVNRLIQDITEPKMPWRELIQTVLTSTIKTDYTFMRPSRRGWHLDAVLPSQNPGEEIDITVAIDTSGSIGNTELKVFLSEIQGIMDSFSGYRIHVFCFDTRVHNPADYSSENLDSIAEYVPGGGGGTDFDCIFDYLKREAIEPNRLIVFTDMMPFGSWGDQDYCDTTWIGYGEYAKTVTPPFGTWATFDE